MTAAALNVAQQKLAEAREIIEETFNNDHLWDYGAYPDDEKAQSTASLVEKAGEFLHFTQPKLMENQVLRKLHELED